MKRNDQPSASPRPGDAAYLPPIGASQDGALLYMSSSLTGIYLPLAQYSDDDDDGKS